MAIRGAVREENAGSAASISVKPPRRGDLWNLRAGFDVQRADYFLLLMMMFFSVSGSFFRGVFPGGKLFFWKM